MPESIGRINIPSLKLSDYPEPKFNVKTPLLIKAMQPLIITGPMEGNIYQDDIIELGKKINAPILADPISQLRFGNDSALI